MEEFKKNSNNIQDQKLSKVEIQLRAELETLRTQVADLQIAANERSDIEEALAREKEQLSLTLLSIGDAVITTDTEGRIVLFNSVAQSLTGWSSREARGKLVRQVLHIVNELTRKTVENPVMKVLETGLVQGLALNTVLVARGGATHIITDSAAPIRNSATGQITGVIFVFRDITKQKQLEQELFKAQKLESIGILAAGIAHDFNNILMSLTSNIWLARMELMDRQVNISGENIGEESYFKTQELLKAAEAAAFRAKDLTGQLLTFAKGGLPIKQTISLNNLLQETARFVLHGSNVQLVFKLPEELWLVDVDPNQLSQVITNLIINSDQATPNGGTLTISAENFSISDTIQQSQLLALPLKSIDYVKVSIKDEGAGISPETLPHIFDPYFSTKHKGHGLGLATAFSIITRHEGFITALSEENKGTTFLIYLPASRSKAPLTAIPAPPKEVIDLPKNGRLLIMDDEKSIQSILKRTLIRAGYEVDLADHGEQAIESYGTAFATTSPYSLVILDLTIPGGMGGLETIARLRKIDPNIKAIVSSGYSDDSVMAHYQDYGFVGKLLKPYQITELYQLIENLLANL